MGRCHTAEDHSRAAGWIAVLPLMGRCHATDGLRRAIGWIAVVMLGRLPLSLPSLGGLWSWVARFYGGFRCG